MDEHASLLTLRMSCCARDLPKNFTARVQLCRGGIRLAAHDPTSAYPRTATRAAQTGTHQLATLRVAGCWRKGRSADAQARRLLRRFKASTQLVEQCLNLRFNEAFNSRGNAVTMLRKHQT